MKKLLLGISLICSIGLQAQSWPWNPDFDSDGVIGTVDLLALLTIYNTEFEAQLLVTDSSSALIYVGDMDLWDCAGTCSSLEGNWKVMDEKILGNFKEDILSWTESTNLTWLDPRAIVGINALMPNSGWQETVQPLNTLASCVCQTRVANPVNMPLIECEYVDLCGVCEGPGPIYPCGCEEIPEWACDCDGNQLDVLGVCGGGCLGDFDGDGICDEYGPGACGGLSTWDYDGFTYDLVEIGGRCWFKQDLRTEHYRNGDSITVGSPETWPDLGADQIGAWAVYPNYEYNGKVYNWYAVDDERNLCPQGWSVPSRDNYQALADTAFANSTMTNSQYAAYYASEVLRDDDTWNGTNELDYSANETSRLGGGNGSWTFNSHYAWSTDYFSITQARTFYLNPDFDSGGTYLIYNVIRDKRDGQSVRCIKDQ